jgi:signal transduction histidine kinase
MMLTAAIAVAVVLSVGGYLMLALLRTELIETAQDDGLREAKRIATLAQRGILPAELPRSGDLSTAVQVTQTGAVISGTPNALNRKLFAMEELKPGQSRTEERETLPIDENGPFRIISIGTKTPSGNATVYVAVDIEDIDEFVDLTAELGGISLIVLVLSLAGVFWVVIGRTLAPVAAIQTRADAITGSALHQRVPEPVGRDEISDLARTINAMLGRLEGSAKRQEAFVGDAAHELRSPIASLQARLETGLGTAEPAEQPLLHDLLRETTRMGRLVEHLLLLARSDAGTISHDRVPVDLDDLIREAAASFESESVSVDISQVEPVQVLGQPALLEQVVSNLLDNAGRFADSRIDVSLHADEGHAVLAVDDDGPGIPPELREDVFERFVRVDESRERGTGGAGLGLAIVAEIVRIHAGEVQVNESSSGGARVRVLLPLR